MAISALGGVKGPDAGAIRAAVSDSVPLAIFAFFAELPVAPLMQGVAVLIAATLILLAGEAGLTALHQVITVVGLPLFLLVGMMIPALICGLAAEDIGHVTIGQRPALSKFEGPQSDESPKPVQGRRSDRS